MLLRINQFQELTNQIIVDDTINKLYQKMSQKRIEIQYANNTINIQNKEVDQMINSLRNPQLKSLDELTNRLEQLFEK